MSFTQTRTTIPEEAKKEGLLAVVIGRAVRGVLAAAGVVAEWARAVQGVVTPLGWAVVAGAIVALAIGYAWGWIEFIAIGWGLALLVAAASVWLIGRGASTIELVLPTPRVVVGEQADARLIAANPGRRRFGGVQLEVPVGGRVIERVLPGLPRGGAFDEQFRIPTERRGIIPVGPARTVRADPVGLMRREIVWSQTVELHVHPRTIAIAALSTGFIRDLEGSPTRDLTASDIAFHALREYVPGDDRRFIHWKSSAKTGTFMVRQFEETRRSRLMVLLDLEPGAYTDDAEFELAVSAAASVGARAIRDARTVSFVVSGRGRGGGRPAGAACASCRPSPATGSSTRSAWSSATTQAVLLPDVARAAAEGLPGVSLAFLVTGTARGVAPLRAAASRLPAGVEAVAVQCAPEGEAAARTVAGLTVFSIGYLEDLRAMLATIGVGRMSAARRPRGGRPFLDRPRSASLLVVAMLVRRHDPVVADLRERRVRRGREPRDHRRLGHRPGGSEVPLAGLVRGRRGVRRLPGGRRPGGGAGSRGRRGRPDAAGHRRTRRRRRPVVEAARDDRRAGRLLPGAPRAALPARAGRRDVRGDHRPPQPQARRRGDPAGAAAARRHRARRGARRARASRPASRSSSPAVAWLVRVAIANRRAITSGRPVEAALADARRVLGASALVAVALVGATAASVALPVPPRSVVRAELQPPFEPREHESPLAGFRAAFDPDVDDDADARGGRTASRGGHPHRHARHLRRVVYSVGGADGTAESGRFTRVPYRLDQTDAIGEQAQLDVVVLGYSDVWVPGIGQLERITFGGPRAELLADGFFYNDVTGTGAVQVGLASGDEYPAQSIAPVRARDLASCSGPARASSRPRPTCPRSSRGSSTSGRRRPTSPGSGSRP